MEKQGGLTLGLRTKENLVIEHKGEKIVIDFVKVRCKTQVELKISAPKSFVINREFKQGGN